MGIEEKVAVSFNVKDNYVIAKYNGQFNVNDALEAFDYVVNHPEYKSSMHRIWEISKAKFEVLENEEINLVANYTVSFPPATSSVKEAMVSEINGNWALLKLFKRYADNSLLQIEIFENLQDAIDWVTSD